MSDEESFVILGSCSPGNSLAIDESLRSGFQSLKVSKIQKDSATCGGLGDDRTPDTSLDEKNKEKTENTEQESMKEAEIEEKSNDNEKENGTQTNEETKKSLDEQQQQSEKLSDENAKSIAATNGNMDRSVESHQSSAVQNGTPVKSSVGSGSSINSSLAASFIMGEVNADVLKSSVYSQFPSICSLESSAEDIVKLQNFMSEYIELKSTLSKVNLTMRQFYDRTQQWREDMYKSEKHYKQQLQSFQQQIAILRNENLELKREMQSRLEQIQLADDIKKKEMTELVQLVSEKAALVENMRAQIEKMECQALASFEYVSKNENDTKQKPDYIARSEHLLAIKAIERKMSQVVAENYELQDMKKIYIDEINCLKVNLTAAEELLQQSRRDIELLKANDMEKCNRFSDYESEHEKMREEIAVLRVQVDTYGRDFHLERAEREKMAGEKDDILKDLRNMQLANQKLIEEQQRRLESVRHSNASTNTTSAEGSDNAEAVDQPLPEAAPFKGTSRFHCPICSGGFQSLAVLQGHVNSCLDNS